MLKQKNYTVYPVNHVRFLRFLAEKTKTLLEIL
jgi:hypothetical protein